MWEILPNSPFLFRIALYLLLIFGAGWYLFWYPKNSFPPQQSSLNQTHPGLIITGNSFKDNGKDISLPANAKAIISGNNFTRTKDKSIEIRDSKK